MSKGTVKKSLIKGNMFKGGLLVASALFVIGATTVAAQGNEYFPMFFGEKAVGIEENQTTMQEAKVISGVKMALEESIIGGKSAIIVVTFEKEDGTEFTKDTKAVALELDWNKNASYMVEQQLTEDGKKLVAMFDIDTTSNINGKKVTIKADELIDTKTNKVVAAGPFHISFIASESTSSQTTKVDLELTGQNEEVAIQHVNISANGLGIEGERLDGNNEYLPDYHPTIQVTTTNDEVIDLYLSSTSTTDTGFKWQYNLSGAGERLLLNTGNVKNVMVDGHMIDFNK